MSSKSKCWRRTIVVFLSVFISFRAFAQRGVAPNGYYPASFRGDTFTGTVVKIDSQTDTLTLEYKNGPQPETLSVTLEGGCSVPSKTGEPMRVKDIPIGTVLTAFHMGQTRKREGQKKKVNIAIAIAFLEWHGKAVSDENRGKVYRRGAGNDWLYYRAFPGQPGAAAPSPAEIQIPPR